MRRNFGLPKVVAVGKIPGTTQESATYSKHADAKVTIAEASALARSAALTPVYVARLAVAISAVALLCSVAAIVVAFLK